MRSPHRQGWVVWWTLLAMTLAAAAQAGPLKRFRERRQENKELILTCIRSSAWTAYLNDGDGEVGPIRDTQNTEEDIDWLGLRFTEYQGPRIRLGVFKVENKSREEAGEWTSRVEVPVAGIEELLTAALYNTQRFDIIERKRIDLVLGEQKRKETVEPSPKALYEAGQVLGIQYLVYGTVNEWEPERGAQRGGLSLIAGSKQEAEVAINFSLTDITNAQVLFNTTERARVGEWSMGFTGLKGESGGSTNKTPINYAVQACVNKAVYRIAMYLQGRRWKGGVVNLKGPDVYVNAGSDQGMQPGMLLTLFARKGAVYDRGMFLGEDLRANGTLKVVSVQTGFSIARVEEGCKGIKVHDRVELASQPSLPPVPPACGALLPPAGV